MESKKKNLNRQSAFADIVVAPREKSQSESVRDIRSRYMKFLYPNGVTLILPGGFPSELLMEYIKAFRS